MQALVSDTLQFPVTHVWQCPYGVFGLSPVLQPMTFPVNGQYTENMTLAQQNFVHIQQTLDTTARRLDELKTRLHEGEETLQQLRRQNEHLNSHYQRLVRQWEEAKQDQEHLHGDLEAFRNRVNTLFEGVIKTVRWLTHSLMRLLVARKTNMVESIQYEPLPRLLVNEDHHNSNADH